MTTVCPVGRIDSPTTYILSCQCNSYGYGLERERESARESERGERGPSKKVEERARILLTVKNLRLFCWLAIRHWLSLQAMAGSRM